MLISISVPVPGVLRTSTFPPCRSIRPMIESAEAVSVFADRIDVEPGSPVADERGGAALVRLDIQRHRRDPGVFGRIHQRLAARRDKGGQLVVEHRVPDDDDLDLDRVVVLDLAGSRSHGVGELAAGRARPVQQRAQFPLLPAGKSSDLARRVGVALNKRERLQHRVVQMCGKLSPLLRTDALGSLLTELREPAGSTRDR